VVTLVQTSRDTPRVRMTPRGTVQISAVADTLMREVYAEYIDDIQLS